MAGVISGQNGKKPFSYIPGGINFNELKSPKMAKRIARHQAQQMENDHEPVRQVPTGQEARTNTLPFGRAPDLNQQNKDLQVMLFYIRYNQFDI